MLVSKSVFQMQLVPLHHGLSDLLLFDFPTAADVAAHVCARLQTTRSYSSGSGSGDDSLNSDGSLNGSFHAGVRSMASIFGNSGNSSLIGSRPGSAAVARAGGHGRGQAGAIRIASTASRRGDGVAVPHRDGISPVAATRILGESDRVCEMSATFGSLLPAVDVFDAELFGAHPSEATVMDPQQRLLLGSAVDADVARWGCTLVEITLPIATLEPAP
jgi:hypothetical protein